MRFWPVTFVALLFVIFTAVVGNNIAKQYTLQKNLSYSVSECKNVSFVESFNSVGIKTEGSNIIIRQNISYVCCAKIVLMAEQQSGIIKIIEENIGEVCRCMCGYAVDAEIKNLKSGKYNIEVWGIKYKELEPQLLGKKEVEIA